MKIIYNAGDIGSKLVKKQSGKPQKSYLYLNNELETIHSQCDDAYRLENK